MPNCFMIAIQMLNVKLCDVQYSSENVKLFDVRHSNDKFINDLNVKPFDVRHSNIECKKRYEKTSNCLMLDI